MVDPAITGLIGTAVGAVIGLTGTAITNWTTGRRERWKLEVELEKWRYDHNRDDHFRFGEYKREAYAELVAELRRWVRDLSSNEYEIKQGRVVEEPWKPIREWIYGVADDGEPIGWSRHRIDDLLAKVQLLSNDVHDAANSLVLRFDVATIREKENFHALLENVDELAIKMRTDLTRGRLD
jgi:hypothetical protein